MNKTLIISGGNINKEFAKQVIEKEKFNNIIAADKGLEILDELGALPTHIVR